MPLKPRQRMPLKPRQQAFADEFIACGNEAEAARRAGYSAKSARKTGYRLRTNADVSAYIAERLRPTEEKRIATADEVMVFYSAVMRGEVKDAFGLDPSLSDRINAGKEIMKRHAAAGNALPGAQNTEDDPLTKSLRDEAARVFRIIK